MDQVVILFVPADMSRQDCEAVLRDRFRLLPVADTQVATETADGTDSTLRASQLWTWFLPNTRPSQP